MPPKDSLTLSLLSRAHSPDSAQRIYSEKIAQRNLLLKPTEGTTNPRNKRRLERIRKIEARHKKSKPKPLSSREKRALGLYEIPKSAQKYEVFEKLNKMWIGYAQEVLFDGRPGGTADASSAAKLCAADFHGAEVEVVRSRCVSRVGIVGFVVRDTKFTFEVVTKSDGVKVVPKEKTIFRFKIPVVSGGEAVGDDKMLVFELHGDQFQLRATDRANKKFKPHFLPDL
jgi:ribonuclease P protein subunit POP4